MPYVAPDEVGEPRILDAPAIGVLTAWVDALVPGDAHWPPASATPAVGYIDAMLARDPVLRPGVQAALATLGDAGFTELDGPGRAAALRELEASSPALFFAVLEMTLEAYYRDPAVDAVVEARTGFRSRRTMTGTPLPPFDTSRLERVRSLPPRWRQA
jgi:hypothetical protein